MRFNPLSVFMFLLWASISKAFHNYSLGAIFFCELVFYALLFFHFFYSIKGVLKILLFPFFFFVYWAF